MQQNIFAQCEYLTQTDRVYHHLMEHGFITNQQARDLYGIYYLTTAIMELRKKFAKEGFKYRIDDEWIKGCNRYGKACRWKKYKLIPLQNCF